MEHLQLLFCILEQIIRNQRRQYNGYVPLTCREKFLASLYKILHDKHETFVNFQNSQKYSNDCIILKEQLEEELKLVNNMKIIVQEENITEKMKSWHQEKSQVLIKELKCRRDVEFKEMQLQQVMNRLQVQNEQITKLEEELLQSFENYQPLPKPAVENILKSNETQEKMDVEIIQTSSTIKVLKLQETQTDPDSTDSPPTVYIQNNNYLQEKLANIGKELSEKDNNLQRYKSKVAELEMNISLFRTQIGDKQSQITFYEKHILELQGKLSQYNTNISQSEIHSELQTGPQDSEENMTLKLTISQLEESIQKKEESILKYQTLLKKDRDEHSLSAVRFQDELKKMQQIIATQEHAYKKLKESSKTSNKNETTRAAVEQYVLQVHELERHTADLHTSVSTLESQLQASRQEAVRWRTLANERLDSMEELRKNLEERYEDEMTTYKNDSDKWREEVTSLQQMISQHRNELCKIDLDVYNRRIKEKDDKIDELSTNLRQLIGDTKRNADKTESLVSPKINELELALQKLSKENETLKKRYEQVMSREKSAKEEIRNFKEQLAKRPISARNERNDKEQQLQKKINSLLKEMEDLKDKLAKELTITEAHKIRVSEDFEKWSKQKHWQQATEKLKIKLKEKTEENDKLQQTCSTYKHLIERLEREKINFESRVKILKNNVILANPRKFEMLDAENVRLHSENDALHAKLQMQQHHSGGLGAAMLQDKLESQERKIAVLELTAKGTGEVRFELERFQSAISNLQKTNLRLEAENMELKMDLDKCQNHVPHLREQIQYLENYIEVLKQENRNSHVVPEVGDLGMQPSSRDTKKVSELERTVFALKRVVEKLQAENKRLQSGGKACVIRDSAESSEQISRLKHQYGECVQKVARLEEELNNAKNRIKSLKSNSSSSEISLSEELVRVKTDLSQKSQLLDKVKVLLHRAAAKEKSLQEEVDTLRLLVPVNTASEVTTAKSSIE